MASNIEVAAPSGCPKTGSTQDSAYLPFMSVVICVYNGQAVIGRAIESVLAQDYPKHLYEIIVVDDGSTDRTQQIVSTYPVQLVRHASNLGLAASRNTGLRNIRGEIYVSFDDDCVARADWLTQLALGFRQQDVAGVGSTIEAITNARSIAGRFIAATGRGNAPSLRLGASANPLRRFGAYWLDQMSQNKSSGPIQRVRELNGATASFATDILRSVGGWDPSLRAAEDNDLCARIAKCYPNLHFVVVSKARLVHDPDINLRRFFRQRYSRGFDNLKHYRRQSLSPPLFPFPLIWFSSIILATFVNPFFGLACLAILPQLLYLWWPIRAIKEHNPWHLLHAYLHLAEECAAIAGLVRGEFLLYQQKKLARKHGSG